MHQYIDYWIEEENLINEKMNKRIIYMVSDYCPNDNLIKFIKKIWNQIRKKIRLIPI